MIKRKMYWRICTAAVVFLTILVFTPLVIPAGIYAPGLFGIPLSLWTSFIITVLLVAITFIGTKVHPGNDEKEDLS